MRIDQTDAILVNDDDYRATFKAEKQAAIELAKSLAAEIGVQEDTAVDCAAWLERVVTSDEQANVASHKASAGARRQQFESKARDLQAERDKNSKK